MKTRTRLPAANGIAPELLPSSFLLYFFAHCLFFLYFKEVVRKGKLARPEDPIYLGFWAAYSYKKKADSPILIPFLLIKVFPGEEGSKQS